MFTAKQLKRQNSTNVYSTYVKSVNFYITHQVYDDSWINFCSQNKNCLNLLFNVATFTVKCM